FAVLLIGFAPRYLLDVRGIAQREIEPFQQGPYRFPVCASGFHGHVCYSQLLQPVAQFQQLHRGGAKDTLAHCWLAARLAHQTTTRYALSMYVDSRTAAVHHSHASPPCFARRAPCCQESPLRTQSCDWFQSVVPKDVQVKLVRGLGSRHCVSRPWSGQCTAPV